MKLKSYKEWRELGYQVQKGEKAVGRCPKTGVALFSRQQVDFRDDPGDCDEDMLDLDHPGHPSNYGDR